MCICPRPVESVWRGSRHVRRGGDLGCIGYFASVPGTREPAGAGGQSGLAWHVPCTAYWREVQPALLPQQHGGLRRSACGPSDGEMAGVLVLVGATAAVARDARRAISAQTRRRWPVNPTNECPHDPQHLSAGTTLGAVDNAPSETSPNLATTVNSFASHSNTLIPYSSVTCPESCLCHSY